MKKEKKNLLQDLKILCTKVQTLTVLLLEVRVLLPLLQEDIVSWLFEEL